LDRNTYNNWTKPETKKLRASSSAGNKFHKNIERKVLYRTKPLKRINHDFYPRMVIKSS